MRSSNLSILEDWIAACNIVIICYSRLALNVPSFSTLTAGTWEEKRKERTIDFFLLLKTFLRFAWVFFPLFFLFLFPLWFSASMSESPEE